MISIDDLVKKRTYGSLESIARKYISKGKWDKFLETVHMTHPKGKSRDAIVRLLNLEAVGGTNADVFKVFRGISGKEIDEIRTEATEKAIVLLKSQIDKENTFFIDIEEMVKTPFAILVSDVLESRKAEVETLGVNPTRNDVLSTYYGFTILTLSGLQSPSTGNSRYWRRRRNYSSRPIISEEAKCAIEQLTNDFGSRVNMETRYETLGGSGFLVEKCNKDVRSILSNVIRMCLYMTPWHRQKAAIDLGTVGDSRVLEFMHHRLETEGDMKTRIGIMQSIGKIGHPESLEHLDKYSQPAGRQAEKITVASVMAIGQIHTNDASDYLNQLLKSRSNRVVAAAILGLSRIHEGDLIPVLKPMLKHRSKPVIRATLDALLKKKSRGHNIIIRNLDSILPKVVSDNAAKSIKAQLFKIPRITSNHKTHDYLAKRIVSLVKNVETYETEGRRYPTHYYYNRRRKKYLSSLKENLHLACEVLTPPYSTQLIAALSHAHRALKNEVALRNIISNSPLNAEIIQNAPLGELHYYL